MVEQKKGIDKKKAPLEKHVILARISRGENFSRFPFCAMTRKNKAKKAFTCCFPNTHHTCTSAE